MIQINPKVPEELRGCKAFGFKTDTHFHEKKRISNLSSSEQLEMNKAVGELKALLEQFQILPCEVTATFGFGDGHQIMEGVINAFDKSSFDKSQEILKQVNVLSFNASGCFEGCSFSVTITQTVTVTNRYKRNNFTNS